MTSSTIAMDNFNFNFTTPARPLTWLITGCSSGFGLAIARHAQANGHKVITTSRNPSKTPDLVREIESNGGRWLPLDLDDRDSAKVINDLEAEGVAIDVLVNNAGFALLHAAEFITDDEVRAQFETVFFGPYRLTRAVLPHMRKRRFGIIVNISTGASLEGRESMGIYSASKAAFDGTKHCSH
jgi:short-subunit dehydrogenase